MTEKFANSTGNAKGNWLKKYSFKNRFTSLFMESTQLYFGICVLFRDVTLSNL
jgi:hypothetical protein